MNHNEIAHQNETRPSEFVSLIRKVRNGFIMSVNGADFVIQGTGDRDDDFQTLINALEDAYRRATD